MIQEQTTSVLPVEKQSIRVPNWRSVFTYAGSINSLAYDDKFCHVSLRGRIRVSCHQFLSEGVRWFWAVYYGTYAHDGLWSTRVPSEFEMDNGDCKWMEEAMESSLRRLYRDKPEQREDESEPLVLLHKVYEEMVLYSLGRIGEEECTSSRK